MSSRKALLSDLIAPGVVFAVLILFRVLSPGVGLAAFVVLAAVKDWAQGRTNPYSGTSMSGKTVLITGGATGLGFETVCELARLGATVVFTARTGAQIATARNQVMNYISSTDAAVRNAVWARVLGIECNLSDLSSVEKAANEFRAAHKRLDVLILNAGIFIAPESRTVQGFESHLGVNFLSHFFLSSLLVDLLHASGPEARVVNVTSSVHHFAAGAKMPTIDDLFDAGKAGGSAPYSALRATKNAKSALIIMSEELPRRFGVASYSLHPGISNTGIMRSACPAGSLFGILNFIFANTLQWPFLKTPLSCAQTQLYCSTAPVSELTSGAFYAECGVADTKRPRLCGDKELGSKLWTRTAQLILTAKDVEPEPAPAPESDSKKSVANRKRN